MIQLEMVTQADGQHGAVGSHVHGVVAKEKLREIDTAAEKTASGELPVRYKQKSATWDYAMPCQAGRPGPFARSPVAKAVFEPVAILV